MRKPIKIAGAEVAEKRISGRWYLTCRIDGRPIRAISKNHADALRELRGKVKRYLSRRDHGLKLQEGLHPVVTELHLG